jgi:NAD(P)-dependent dehydrogenase (short-subunit alcohol dehydrogenase family)
LAVEWARYGLRVNAIAPGPFPTEGAWSRLLPSEEFKHLLLNRVPMRRVGEHAELANLAVLLVSDQVSYINGECVVIDGGEWLKGAGQFNEFERITPEQWDMVEAMRRQ